MGGHRLVGVFVMKLREREGEALGDLDGALDRMLLAAKQLQHLLDRLEMTLAIDLEPEARFRDGAFFADAGQDILQHAPVGMVIEHVIGGDERCPVLACRFRKRVEPRPLAGLAQHARRQIGRLIDPATDLGHDGKEGRLRHPRRRHDREQRAVLEFCHIIEGEDAFALRGAPLPARHQPGEPAIGGPVLGQARGLQSR